MPHLRTRQGGGNEPGTAHTFRLPILIQGVGQLEIDGELGGRALVMVDEQ